MRFDDVKESAFMALDTLRANKLRSALTILGVSVGVVTVIFMVSIIQGLNKAFADQIESLGSNTIFVSKFDPAFGRPPGPEEIHRKELTIEDGDTIRNEASSIAGVAPFYRKVAETVQYRGNQSDTPILIGATWGHIGNGWVFSAANGGWEYPVFLIAASLVLALLGDGRYALSNVFHSRKPQGVYA